MWTGRWKKCWIECDFKMNQGENDERQINCLGRKHFKLSSGHSVVKSDN